jgi:hypothetical protein
MSTSQTTELCEPIGSIKISRGTLGYVCARHRQRQYDIVIREFKKGGLTQADLARRLGKSREVISRLLARPGNWESDTFSELLFGISGAIAAYRVDYPFSRQTFSSTDWSNVTPLVGCAKSFSGVQPTDVSDVRTGSDAISSRVAA